MKRTIVKMLVLFFLNFNLEKIYQSRKLEIIFYNVLFKFKFSVASELKIIAF